jgi:tRNA (guanine37-N1)-methyltransferase
MRFDIVTIFPEIFRGPFDFGIVKRAIADGLVEIAIHDLRDYTDDRHRQVDDRPFGGGAGMVMKPEPLFRAIDDLSRRGSARVVLLSPQGRLFSQEVASQLSRLDRLILICGRYEGVDERVVENVVDDEISIGDYVLSGGEVPAMVVVEAIVRLLPGALGCEASVERESFSRGTEWQGLLDYPQYTRPANYQGLEVPEVLLRGNHAEIERWRRGKAIEKTLARRPDLFQGPATSNAPAKGLDRGDERPGPK